jgi:hypothetical protein
VGTIANIRANKVEILDGWKAVYYSGMVYYEFYDEGVFIRDKILIESGLPLKLIDSEIEGILTDF